MLMRHLGDVHGGDQIESAIQQVLATGIRYRDLGGSVGTKDFGEAVHSGT